MASAEGGRSVVIDAGGYSLRVGAAGSESPVRSFPNCAVKPKRERRLFVGDQIDDQIIDHSSLHYRRPLNRGYTVNWRLQAQVGWGPPGEGKFEVFVR